jgi:hypothetical protein
MTSVQALVLRGVTCALVSVGTSLAVTAADTAADYKDFLEELEKLAPSASRNVTIPSPKSVPAEVIDPTQGDEGEAALRNLEKEESLRIDREIRDMLER